MSGPEKIAVIDVGSNSCRLVIYEHIGAALLPYFNEKTMAGLGRNLSETGVLFPDGRIKALDTLRRFRAILEGLGITNIVAVATAAVREAEDGAAFQDAAAAALGLPLTVLSGADEGRLSAQGVLTGFGDVSGIVADLGGSSIEIQACDKGKMSSEAESFLLGPLARIADAETSMEARRGAILQALAASRALADHPGTLIAVGGAWRNLAVVHMMLTDYPLRVVNGYRLNRKALGLVIEALGRAERDKTLQQKIEKIAKKRYGTMLHAALVLDGLLETSKVKAATISAYGLRDGVVGERLGTLGQGDSLTDTSQLFMNLSEDSMAFGSCLAEFVAPLFGTDHPDWGTITATCQIADAGARMHPDHRPNLIFQQVVRAPLPRLDHRARLLAASSVAWRYTFRFQIPGQMRALMSEQDQVFARILGTAMRLGGAFSGRSSSILTTSKLERNETALTLRVWKKNEDMVSGTVKRRLRQLSGLLDLEPRIEIVERF